MSAIAVGLYRAKLTQLRLCRPALPACPRPARSAMPTAHQAGDVGVERSKPFRHAHGLDVLGHGQVNRPGTFGIFALASELHHLMGRMPRCLRRMSCGWSTRAFFGWTGGLVIGMLSRIEATSAKAARSSPRTQLVISQ